MVPLVALGLVGHRHVGSGFMPATDEGGFILDYRAAPGTSLTETDRLLRQVEGILQATPEVQTYSRRTGVQLGGGLTESNEGDYFIRLVPPPRRGIDAVMDDVRGRVERRVPGLDIEMAQLMEDLIGDLTAVPQPIEIKLFADDGAVLEELAPRVAARLGRIPGVVDVQDGIVPAGDALRVRVERDRAALEGVDPDDVAQMLSDLVGGAVATSLPQGREDGGRARVGARARPRQRPRPGRPAAPRPGRPRLPGATDRHHRAGGGASRRSPATTSSAWRR